MSQSDEVEYEYLNRYDYFTVEYWQGSEWKVEKFSLYGDAIKRYHEVISATVQLNAHNYPHTIYLRRS